MTIASILGLWVCYIMLMNTNCDCWCNHAHVYKVKGTFGSDGKLLSDYLYYMSCLLRTTVVYLLHLLVGLLHIKAHVLWDVHINQCLVDVGPLKHPNYNFCGCLSRVRLMVAIIFKRSMKREAKVEERACLCYMWMWSPSRCWYMPARQWSAGTTFHDHWP